MWFEVFPSPKLGLSLKYIVCSYQTIILFPSPYLGPSLKLVLNHYSLSLLSFRPLIWGHL